nr:EAL domain-containing protein [uncultured Lichenicoccus sp.]
MQVEPQVAGQMLEVALSAADLGSWWWDVASDVAIFDDRLAAMTGHAADALRQRDWRELLHPDDRPHLYESMRAHVEGRTEEYHAEFRLRHRDGHWIWLLSRGRLMSQAVRSNLVFGILLDLTRRKRDELALAEARDLLEGVLDGAQLASWRHDCRTGRTTRNRRWSSLFGYARGEIDESGSGWRSLIHPEDRAGAEQAVRNNRVGLSEGMRHEYRLRCADGSYRWVLDWGRTILRDAEGEPLVIAGTLMDINADHRAKEQIEASRRALAQSEARARYAALHDSLTGLANRAGFNAALLERIASLGASGSLGVLYLDLDDFKLVNDGSGHQAGDHVLVEVARRLRATCSHKSLVARIGGDEFAVLVPDMHTGELRTLAQALVSVIAGTLSLPAGRVRLGASIGATLLTSPAARRVTVQAPGLEGSADGAPPQGAPADAALYEADLALYHAKKNGRGRYCIYRPEMGEELRRRRALEMDLRGALPAGGLELFYQPQRSGSGRLIGVEALARWTHPDYGAVAPDQFIPIAEQGGLIEDLGLWAIRRAIRDTQALGELRVAVNVSPLQLRAPGFVDAVRALLAETGFAAERLEMEITESVLMTRDAQTRTNLLELQQAGILLALDDFGNGYSSLSYIADMPISRIKIDRSFTSQLETKPAMPAIMRAFRDLGAGLGIAVMAEGIETVSQQQKLEALGISEFQGWLHGRPMPVAQLAELVASESRRQGLRAIVA